MPYLVLRSKSALINMQEMMQWWSRSQLDIVVLAQRLRAYINKIAISLGTEMTSIMNVVSMKYDIECLKLIKDQIKEDNGTLHGRYLKKLNSKSSQTFGLIKISLPHTQNHTLFVSYLIEEEIWSDLGLDNIYVRIHCQGRVRYFRKDGNMQETQVDARNWNQLRFMLTDKNCLDCWCKGGHLRNNTKTWNWESHWVNGNKIHPHIHNNIKRTYLGV